MENMEPHILTRHPIFLLTSSFTVFIYFSLAESSSRDLQMYSPEYWSIPNTVYSIFLWKKILFG